MKKILLSLLITFLAIAICVGMCSIMDLLSFQCQTVIVVLLIAYLFWIIYKSIDDDKKSSDEDKGLL